jgi:hypothetical protein
MNDLIDYSRPVGWWCCQSGQTYTHGADHANNCPESHASSNGARPLVPVYLPLPTPEPVEVDEVETGEAEVVTCTDVGSNLGAGYCVHADISACLVAPSGPEFLLARVFQWPAAAPTTDYDINRIANASANARKKRGCGHGFEPVVGW